MAMTMTEKLTWVQFTTTIGQAIAIGIGGGAGGMVARALGLAGDIAMTYGQSAQVFSQRMTELTLQVQGFVRDGRSPNDDEWAELEDRLRAAHQRIQEADTDA